MGREAKMEMAELLPRKKNMDNKQVLFQNCFHGPILRFFFLLFFSSEARERIYDFLFAFLDNKTI